MASLSGVQEVILVARSDGGLAADVRPLVRLNVTVIVEANGRRESGSHGGGGRVSYQYFLENDFRAHLCPRGGAPGAVNLDAGRCSGGSMQVVLGPGWPGILLHEAIGHGLEGDFNRKGTSAFAGMVGQQVARAASRWWTTARSPTGAVRSRGRRGHAHAKDRAHRRRHSEGYLQDTLNARLMNVAPTGNGRRESYAHMPLPRMTTPTCCWHPPIRRRLLPR